MAGHITIDCPACQTSYRLSISLEGKRVRCKACSEPIRVIAPRVATDGQDFDDTVIGWLAESEREQDPIVPKPRIISARHAVSEVEAAATVAAGALDVAP